MPAQIPNFSELEKTTGLTFSNKNLLKQAFVHRSYINENKSVGLSHNERLEYLGDAVLELVTTEYLYNSYPDKQEGELTSFRAALVNTIAISGIASELNMNDYLLLSKGESKDTGRARQVILANTFEALIGAIYLDMGYDAAKKFIADNLLVKAREIIENNLWKDPKSSLQEKAQEVLSITPSYKTLKETGPDHNKMFVIGLYFGDELIAEGRGHSKQEAQEDAARNGMKKRKWL